ADGFWRQCKDQQDVHFNGRYLQINGRTEEIHYAIPCIHGPPGETGDVQSLFELARLPYFGSAPEGSRLCFNKISTKLWLEALHIPVTPYKFISSMQDLATAQAAFDEWKYLFVKASSQGSSVGVYLVTDRQNLEYTLVEAFRYSPYVLLEKRIEGRELEVAVYEYDGKLQATVPGEIICPNKFYSYEEKYDQDSQTTTATVAPDLPQEVVAQIKAHALKAFEGLKLRHLARADFFYTHDGQILLNEINTFPGMTPISMFPKMLMNNGHQMAQFFGQAIDAALTPPSTAS
ncbi:MAG: D-alanine--D-alanine ligase, partial [Bacteriovoracaceae bacterium]|nr:D-alanine--D-alanine ligase [Bacteriovoracaceae bacterium]